jgi:glutathione S-transferase
VYLTLLEKGVPFNTHVLGPGTMGHLSEEYKKINPRGQVPAMVHDGTALIEGMTINEYIDETFDGPSLRPKEPFERERMRVWCRYSENDLGRALMMINWNRVMPNMRRNQTEEQSKQFANNVPDPDRRRSWLNAMNQGTPTAEIEESYRRVVVGVERIEQTLRKHKWIAGNTYSLADIDLLNFYGHQSMWPPNWIKALTNETMTPATMDWLARLSERPAVKQMHADTRMPGPPPQAARN